MADEVLIGLLNRAPKRRAAILRGYVRGTVRGENYPGIMPSPSDPQGHKVEGLLIEDLSSRELRALDFYEDDDYERVEVTVEATTMEAAAVVEKRAMVYLFAAARRAEIDLERPWSLQAFRAERLNAFVREEVVPCAAAFNEEESTRQRQRRVKAVSAAVVAVGACAVAYMRRSVCVR